MQVFAGTKQFHIDEPTSVAIGKFDGRHKGHQKLLCEMLKLREQYGYKAAVFTFGIMPSSVVTGEAQTLLTTNQERRNNIGKMGIDYLVEYPFDKSAARMPPEEFISRILAAQMNAKAVVAGTDCGFGYKRAGTADLLRSLAPKYGFMVKIIEKEQDEHRDISSTYIKEELNRGNIEKANELLGEPYSIHGVVVHGNHIGGSRLGFPTANILPPPEKHLPPFGVYVTRVLIDGKYYGGVTNIGKKPTVEGDAPVGVETFLLEMESGPELYGKPIEVQLLNFERPERKFVSLDALKTQIEKDKEYASSYLNASLQPKSH